MPPTDNDTQRPLPAVRLLIATSNAHKLGEIASLLAQAGTALEQVQVVGADLLPPGPPPVEDGETFEANAVIKATAFALRAAQLPEPERPHWVLADDSGLCVEALGGAPGVHSARFAGEAANDEKNNAKLLAAIQNEKNRAAEFVCVLACGQVPGNPSLPFSPAFTVEGRCGGRIAETPYGGGGFGYDPLFFVPAEGATFAELSPQRKNELSHRGNALRSLSTRLIEALRDPPGMA